MFNWTVLCVMGPNQCSIDWLLTTFPVTLCCPVSCFMSEAALNCICVWLCVILKCDMFTRFLKNWLYTKCDISVLCLASLEAFRHDVRSLNILAATSKYQAVVHSYRQRQLPLNETEGFKNPLPLSQKLFKHEHIKSLVTVIFSSYLHPKRSGWFWS